MTSFGELVFMASPTLATAHRTTVLILRPGDTELISAVAGNSKMLTLRNKFVPVLSLSLSPSPYLCVSLSFSLSLSLSGSLIGFMTVTDSAVSQSEMIHLHVMNIHE